MFYREENNNLKQVTYDSYTVDEYSELIQNLKDISNIQQCSFQLMLCYPHFGHLSFQVLFTFFQPENELEKCFF